jgi:Tripartite tricarboxylate transporter TctB family.
MSHAPAPGGKAGLRPQDRIATLVIAGLVAAVAIAAIVVAQDFPATTLETDVGPARFPILYSIALLVLCGILAINTLRAPSAPRAETPAAERPSYGAVALGIAGTAACLLAMDYVGYGIATGVYLFGLMTLMGRRNLLMNAVIAAVLTAAIYATFAYALSVPLPMGSLFE